MPYNNRSVRFNEGSTDEYAKAGNILGFEHTDAFSFSLRVKLPTTEGWIFTKMENTPGYRGWGVYCTSAGAIRLYLTSDWSTGNYILVETTTTTLVVGRWYHVAIAYTGSSAASGISIEINDVAQSLTVTMDALSGTIVNSAEVNLATRTNTTGSVGFSVWIDDVAVYSDALTSAEITWLYNTGEPRSPYDSGAPDNLVAYWRCGDGDTFPTLNDNSLGALATSVAASSVQDFGPYRTYAGSPQNMEVGDIVSDSPGGVAIGSLEFDGVNEWINFGNILAFGRYEPYTLSTWVKSTDTGVLLAKWVSSTPAGYIWSAGIDSMAFGMVRSWSTNGFYLGCTATGILDGNWHLATVTNTGSGNASGSKFYLDAALLTNGTPAFDNLVGEVQHSSAFTAAKDFSGADNPLAGKLCHAAAHNKALSLSEIQWIYNSGAPRNLLDSAAPSGLVAWWPLGQARRPATMVNMESTDIVGDSPDRGITKELRFSAYLQRELGTPQAFKELGRGHYAILGGIKDSPDRGITKESRFSAYLQRELGTPQAFKELGRGQYSTLDGILGKYSKPTEITVRKELLLGKVGGGPAAVTYYWLRVRDSGLGPPPVYRMWVSEDPDSDPPPPGPTGSWVDRAMLGKWAA